jgi:hypothetical protein
MYGDPFGARVVHGWIADLNHLNLKFLLTNYEWSLPRVHIRLAIENTGVLRLSTGCLRIGRDILAAPTDQWKVRQLGYSLAEGVPCKQPRVVT